MAKIEKPLELLTAELRRLLYVEQQLAESVIPQLLSESNHSELKQGVTLHLQQTRGHVTNLERAFELVDAEAKAEKSPAFDGLVDEHARSAGKTKQPRLLDLVHADAVAKTEHLEIAAYETLVQLAEDMDQNELAALLRENLEDEQKALDDVKKALADLTRQAAALAGTR